jgi:hypothetical protein
MAFRHPGIRMAELRRDDGARHALDRETACVAVTQDMEADRRADLGRLARHAHRPELVRVSPRLAIGARE